MQKKWQNSVEKAVKSNADQENVLIIVQKNCRKSLIQSLLDLHFPHVF